VACDADVLRECLSQVTDDNAAGEIYLTDVIAIAHGSGRPVGAFVTTDLMQTEGVNTRAQLATLGRVLNQRVLDHWMSEGVEVIDPATTWVDVTVRLAPDVSLRPGVQLHGSTTVETGAVIGPDTTLTDVKVGAGATIVRTHATGADLGAGVSVGPFAYVRPGTVVGRGGKIGAFVETKQAILGEGAKVPHLSYVGDAEIGEGANVGAGTIFANYDGEKKHRTKVGAHARTGANNTFVAPVTIGDGAAYVAATGPGQFTGNVSKFDAVTGDRAGGKEMIACSLASGSYGVWVAGCPNVQKLSTGDTNPQFSANVVIPFAEPASAANQRESLAGMAQGEGAVWVIGDAADRRLWRIDPLRHRITATIALGFPPGGVAVGNGGVWVTDELGDRVVRIDPATSRAAAEIPVGRGALGITTGAGSVWVADAVDHAVTRIDPITNRVTATILVPAGPRAVAVGEGSVWAVGDAR